MSRQVAEVFGRTPETLDDFVVLSQIVQAEAKKYFVEMTRLRKWRKTGVLWWNLIDGWPQFSDAVMDYFYCPKLAYFYLRRVQQPVCVMVDEPEDWRCRVVLGNDSLERVQGTFRIWDAATGETIWEGGGTAERNANTVLTAIPASRGQQRLLLIEWETEGIKGGNHYLLGSPPFNGTWYRELLPAIAALPCGFDSLAVGK
jgi:beta-mannosidase